MKKVVCALMVVGLTSAVAFANVLENFQNDVVELGLEQTVANAVEAGAPTEQIVEQGLAIESVNPGNLIKSLFCSGLKGEEIRTVASQFNVSEMIVDAGYQQSVAECQDQLADAQPFTPAATAGAPSFAGRRPAGGGTFADGGSFGGGGGGGGGGTFASPSAP